jgi:(2R)-3-sulfolactate dehydrogenase (NADP+)
MLLADADVRLPGMRRQELARRAAIDGVDVTDALLTQLRSLADDAA